MAKPHIITGLDIGTNTIKTLVVQKRHGESDLEILSECREKSSGIRRGVVVNVEEASDVISACLKKAEEKSGRRINDAYVNVGGSHIFCAASRGLVSVSRADQKISSEDIERVIQAAQTFSLPSNKEILEVFPKEFIVDGERGVKEILGMRGVRIEAEVLAVGGFSPYLKNLTQAVLNSDLQINDLALTPLAGSRAVLAPREKELGVAILDIGAGNSSLAIFEEGNLIHIAIFPIGGSNITNDIAIGLRTDIDTAERIKLDFGLCVSKKTKGKEKMREIKGGSDSESVVFPQKSLAGIIEARVSEIFEQVEKELKKISRQGLLPAGIVLVGGGAKLPKIIELAKKELKLPCRIGRPNKGIFPPQEDPVLATVCGLVLMGADLEGGHGAPGFNFHRGFEANFGAKLKKIFKNFLP
jgi:cell division protein FtsA